MYFRAICSLLTGQSNLYTAILPSKPCFIVTYLFVACLYIITPIKVTVKVHIFKGSDSALMYI